MLPRGRLSWNYVSVKKILEKVEVVMKERRRERRQILVEARWCFGCCRVVRLERGFFRDILRVFFLGGQVGREKRNSFSFRGGILLLGEKARGWRGGAYEREERQESDTFLRGGCFRCRGGGKQR